MKKNLKYYLLTLVAALATMAGMALGQNTASAVDTNLMLTVSPMEQKMTLYPGETSTGAVRVSNQASATETLYYKVSVAPFTRSGKKYDPVVGDEIEGGEYNDITNWVTLSSESGALAPNEYNEITYTVNVPENVRGGGQYFAIVVTRTSGPNANEESGTASLTEVVQIASTVYAMVSGSSLQLSGAIRDNNIQSFFLTPPITASFTAENTGNTHMEINYYMQVFPLFSDEEIYTNEEEPEYAIVLPGTTRYVSQEWKDTPLIGAFKVRQTVMYGSGDDNTSTTEKMVIVCPLWLLFIIIFAIAAIIIYFVMRSKGRKK